MRWAAALLPLVVLLAALPPVAGSAAAAGAGAAPVGTTMTVALQNDGDARWNVTMRFELADGNETAAFEELAAAYENGSARAGPDDGTVRTLVARADGATDRRMSVGDVRREARILESGEAGILTLAFTWRNFSAVENGTLVVGDAFPVDWSLAADQRLVIHPPPGYLLSTYFPGTDGGVQNGILRWDGPRAFAAGEPHVEYSLADGPGGGNGETTPGGDGAESDPGTLAAGALLVAGAALVAYVLAVRTRSPHGTGVDDEDGERNVVTDGDAGATIAGDRPEARTEGGGDPERGSAAGASAAEDEGGAGGEDAGTSADVDAEAGTDADTEAGPAPAPAPDADLDPELLSDEERVERLLRKNGGRMKQARIVEETGWSNAKVSQLLSGMADEERIEKLRIGRENLISLPDAGEWGANTGSGSGPGPGSGGGGDAA